MQNTYDLFIGNERVQTAGQERFAAINPYTREEWASVPQASAAQVADAIAAARHAYDTVWRKTSGQERARLMHRLADIMQANADRMGIAGDHRQRQGDPRDAQPDAFCRTHLPLLRRLCGQDLRRRDPARSAATCSTSRGHEPLGVVGADHGLEFADGDCSPTSCRRLSRRATAL